MSDPITPCRQNAELRNKIVEYAEELKVQAHEVGSHGLTEREFYDSGLFRGAIERIRGQFSASMREKRDFVASIFDYMRANGFIDEWKSAGEANRHDYEVTLNSGRISAIELKGCLDGNNTNIFSRPPNAHEFVLWSICQNPGANPRKNAWSGIHTRLSPEIIERGQVVDGLMIWDMMCGTVGRPCPKLSDERLVHVGDYSVPPPCIYLFPPTVPSPRNNPSPAPNRIQDVGIFNAFSECFGAKDEEINHVFLEVAYEGVDTVRTTRIERGGEVITVSKPTAIKRS